MVIQETLDQLSAVQKENPIYDDFIDSFLYIGPLEPTKALNRKHQFVESKRSLSLKPDKGDDSCTTLIKRFGIINEPLFRSKYEEAVSGNGCEGRRILTLHSSSLCALLHFYNPEGLLIPLEAGKTGQVTLHVLGSAFEYKNKVFDLPSNVDVVLYGYIEETKENCLLFLESKYSEYFRKSKVKFSGKYGSDYNDFFKSLSYLKCLKYEDGLTINAEDGQSHYYDGIKQMASHLIGIKNFMNGIMDPSQDLTKIPSLYQDKENTRVYFGEIAYEHDGAAFSQWRKDYNRLAYVYNNNHESEITSERKCPKMADCLLTYQDLFLYEDRLMLTSGLEPEICFFYNHINIIDKVGLFAFDDETFNYVSEYLDELDCMDTVAKTMICKEDFISGLKKTYKGKLPLSELKIGSVEYDFTKHLSFVYIDKALLNNQTVKDHIIEVFNLKKNKTVFSALKEN